MKHKMIITIILTCTIILITLTLIIHYDINGIQIPVILYHHFLNEEELKKNNNNDNYAVSQEMLEQQMNYLYENGYKSITLDELYCWKIGKCEVDKKSFVITIDDGLTSTYKYAKPILKKYRYNATLFTISSRINDTTEDWDSSYLQYIGKDIIESNDEIIDIQSHSHNLHHKINGTKAIETMNYKEILNDITTTRQILNAQYLSYPYNTYNNKAFKALKANNFKLAFRGTNHKTYKNENNYMVSRIFINNDLNEFKTIFESKNFDQSLIDKIKTDLIRFKKLVIK